jgi:hypothetical protein
VKFSGNPERVDRSLGDVAPKLATYVIETIYGEIYQARCAHPAARLPDAGSDDLLGNPAADLHFRSRSIVDRNPPLI